MSNAKNIYYPQAKALKAELLTLDICSQFLDGYLEVEGYYQMHSFSFKEINDNRSEVLKKAKQYNHKIKSKS